MYLLFYPSDFNLQNITTAVDDEIDTLKTLNLPYKVFNYNYISVEEQKGMLTLRSYGRCLHVALTFIKSYVLDNPSTKFHIFLYTDGYSNSYTDINISDYITDNIVVLKYILLENKYNLGKLDFQERWLMNKKFRLVT